MNEIIKQKQRARLDILNKIYEMSGGNTDKLVDGNKVANSIDLSYDFELVDTAINYLKDKCLVEDARIVSSPFPVLKITHSGVNEIERSLSYPNESSEYFEAFNTLKLTPQNITINNSSGIQLGGSYNTQTTNIKVDSANIFREIKNSIENSIDSEKDKKAILSTLAELEIATNTVNYQNFISSAANYMTIISPFIPTLTELIS